MCRLRYATYVGQQLQRACSGIAVHIRRQKGSGRAGLERTADTFYASTQLSITARGGLQLGPALGRGYQRATVRQRKRLGASPTSGSICRA